MRARDRISLCACAATMGFCALALGGAVRWAAVAASCGAVVAALPYVTSRRVAASRSPLLVLIGVALALTALQLVPLPMGMLARIAPEKARLIADNATALGGAAPGFAPASFDPPSTVVELAKLVGYAALALACLRIASERGGKRALASVAVGGAVLIAVVSVAHELLGLRAIYGAWMPPVRHPLLSPIVNDNHFAALMGLTAPLAFGLALTAQRARRALWLGASLLLAGCALYISSRGGALGLVIALGVTALLVLIQRRATAASDDTRRPRTAVPIIIVATCAVVLLVALTAQHVIGELSETTVGQLETDPHWKVQAWKHALPMLSDNRWLGTGRGTFEQAFARYDADGQAAYSHAENSYLQTAFDWGIPGALAIFAAAAWMVIACARRWRQSPLEAGALGALAGLAAHDVVDFSMELPIVAMIAIVLVAIVLPLRMDGTAAKPRARVLWLRGAVALAALAVCVVAALPLARAARDEAIPDDAAGAIAVFERHPADYLLAGRAAQALFVAGDERAVPVISRALFLNPRHAGVHQLAASMLAGTGQMAQAQTELATAIEVARYAELPPLIEEAVASFPDPVEAAHALPLDAASAQRVVPHLLAHQHEGVALAYTRLVALLAPDDAGAQVLFARAALAAHSASDALEAARAAYRLDADVESASLLAHAEAAMGDTPAAIGQLRAALGSGLARSGVDRQRVLADIADLELAAGELAAASATIDELAHGVADTQGGIAVHLLRAELHDKLGETAQANWERAQAGKLQ